MPIFVDAEVKVNAPFNEDMIFSNIKLYIIFAKQFLAFTTASIPRFILYPEIYLKNVNGGVKQYSRKN